MSYCVNCGVELEKSEKRCPLCGVEVINPAQPPEDKEPRQRPYPNRIEELSMNINKQFAAALLSVFMVFAAAICCVCNIIIDKSITWSQYVIGAIFFTWVAVTVPLLFKRAVLIKSIVLDIAALLFFLFMVSRLDGSSPWFTTVAVPIVSVVASMTLIIVLGVKYNYIMGAFPARRHILLRRAALPAYRNIRGYIFIFGSISWMEHFCFSPLHIRIYTPAYPQAHNTHKAGIKKAAPYLNAMRTA